MQYQESPDATDYRLTRVEREVAELRSRIESGQTAMLQAVSAVQTQLAQFQLSLAADLGSKFVSQREAADFTREMRERADANMRRLDKHDQIYIQGLEESRQMAATKLRDDADHATRTNIALFTSVASFVGAVLVHFLKIPGVT